MKKGRVCSVVPMVMVAAKAATAAIMRRIRSKMATLLLNAAALPAPRRADFPSLSLLVSAILIVVASPFSIFSQFTLQKVDKEINYLSISKKYFCFVSKLLIDFMWNGKFEWPLYAGKRR